jgi:hypothetical protein
MDEKEQKTENTGNTAEKVRGVPFKEGFDPRRNLDGRPPGSKNFTTLFKKAVKEVAKKLELGEDPDAVEVEIIKRGIKEALAGKYPFYRDIFDRIYGQPKGNIDITSGDEKIVFKIVKDDGKDNQTSSETI